MCDQAKYSALDERVDSIDQRLSSCEKELATIKDDCRTGFARVETAMNNVLEERRAWSAWARENLPKVGKWLARWLIILIGIAIGVNNMKDIKETLFGSAAPCTHAEAQK